jgi:hypothetical protein
VFLKGNRSFVNLDAAEHVEPVGSRGITALSSPTIKTGSSVSLGISI